MSRTAPGAQESDTALQHVPNIPPQVKEVMNPSSPYAKFLTSKQNESFKIPQKRMVNVQNMVGGGSSRPHKSPSIDASRTTARQASVEATVRYDKAETAAAPASPSTTNAAAPPPTAGDKKVVSASSGEWTEAQELALVRALKQFGKELGQERWAKIAEVVSGKSKAECFKRYKELQEAFKAKKEATAAAAD